MEITYKLPERTSDVIDGSTIAPGAPMPISTKDRFGLYSVVFEPNRLVAKDYEIVLNWMIGILFSIFLLICWGLSETYFIRRSFLEIEWSYLAIAWLVAGWFLAYVFRSVIKPCPKHDFFIDIRSFATSNPRIVVKGNVRHNWTTTVVEYLVDLVINWHEKMPLRTIGFGSEASAMKYAKAISNYYGMPIRSDFRTIRELNGFVRSFFLYFVLPILLLQATIILKHLMR